MTNALANPTPPRGKVRVLADVFGWKMPVVTLVGLQFVVLVALIPFVGAKPVSWLEETALATFAGGLTLIGAISLRERWLSFAPHAGFTVRPPRPRPVLRWLGCAGLTVLGGVLLVGGFTESLPDPRSRWLVPLLGTCCVLGALFVALISLRRPVHVLVREGLALRYRHGCSLIPWDRIGHIDIGTYYENVIATVTLSHLLTPLPTAWTPGVSEEQRRRRLEQQLRGFEKTRRWIGADVLVWGWSCKMPPGLFALRARECLADPDARLTRPPFEEVGGAPPDDNDP